MIKTYIEFINESLKIKDLQLGKNLGTWYHGTISKKIDLTRDIHVGTYDQADDRIDMDWSSYLLDEKPVPTFYLFEMTLVLQNPCPKILYDVDKGVGHTKEDFLKYGNYNEYAYRNIGEGDTNSKKNLSFYIVDPKRCLFNIKLIQTIN